MKPDLITSKMGISVEKLIDQLEYGKEFPNNSELKLGPTDITKKNYSFLKVDGMYLIL